MAKQKDHPMAACMITNRLNVEFWQLATREPQAPQRASFDAEYNAAEREKYERELYFHNKILEALSAAELGDGFPLAVWVAEKLAPCGVRDVHVIIHDRDKDEYGLDASLHPHIVVRFEGEGGGREPRTLANVARLLGVERQYIDRPKQGKYGIDNLLSYMCHVKYPEKYQYPVEDFASVVVASDGQTYEQIYHARREEWLNGRGAVKAKEAEQAVDGLIERILDGRITRQMIFLDRKLQGIYARNRKKVEDALFTYGKGKFEKAKREVLENKWSMVVIYFSGHAGDGKTLYARYLAENLNAWFLAKHGEDWQCFDAAAQHSLDNYNCEEIIIMDDLDGDSFSPADWKRLLDNHTTQLIAARYHDATPIAKVLMITSTKSPLEFFEEIALGNHEDLGQYIRRITAQAEVLKCIEQSEDGNINLDGVSFRMAFPRKVDPYLYGANAIPLEYALKGESREYAAEAASVRMLGMVEKAQIPRPKPFPAGWKERLLSLTPEQLIAMTDEAEAREKAAAALPAPAPAPEITPEIIDLPF